MTNICNMPRNRIRATQGIGLFAVFVFVLTAVPRLSIKFGPIPLYFVDILIVALLAVSLGQPKFRSGPRPFAMTVILLAIFAIAGEATGAMFSGEILEPIYIAGRTLLAFSVFYVTGQLVRNAKDLEIVMKSAVLGIIVTATLMILTSLPMTRSAVTSIVFSVSFLEPAADSVVETYSADVEGGVRGRTLVGVSILGASFLNIMWPCAALLVRWPVSIGMWRTLAWIACSLAPMGVLMSYSRGPILGTGLLLFATLLLGLSHVRRGMVLPIALGASIVATVGIGSQIFYFDRLANRTEAIFDDPTADERESERILAYIEPFEHVAELPIFFVLGEGNAIRRSNVYPEQAGRATHAVFAMAYYAWGMVAAFLLVGLIIRALLFAWLQYRRASGTILELQSQAMFLSLVALLPWAVFGHAIVSTPRGTMLFFLQIGLLSALSRFPVRIKFPRVGPPVYVNGRRTAF